MQIDTGYILKRTDIDLVAGAMKRLLLSSGKLKIDMQPLREYAATISSDIVASGMTAGSLMQSVERLKSEGWGGKEFGELPGVTELIKAGAKPGPPALNREQYSRDGINFKLVDRGDFNTITKKCYSCGAMNTKVFPKDMDIDMIKTSWIKCHECSALISTNRVEQP